MAVSPMEERERKWYCGLQRTMRKDKSSWGVGRKPQLLNDRTRLVFKAGCNVTISSLPLSLVIWSLSELNTFQRLYANFPCYCDTVDPLHCEFKKWCIKTLVAEKKNVSLRWEEAALQVPLWGWVDQGWTKNGIYPHCRLGTLHLGIIIAHPYYYI